MKGNLTTRIRNWLDGVRGSPHGNPFAGTNSSWRNVDLGERLDDLANLGQTDNGKGASMIGVEDAAGYFTASDLESILAELVLIAAAASSVGPAAGQVLPEGAGTPLYDTNVVYLYFIPPFAGAVLTEFHIIPLDGVTLSTGGDYKMTMHKSEFDGTPAHTSVLVAADLSLEAVTNQADNSLALVALEATRTFAAGTLLRAGFNSGQLADLTTGVGALVWPVWAEA